MNYTYVTRKQANIIYAAIKRGELHATKKFINRLYDSVERTNSGMDSRVNGIIDYLFKGNIEFAQALIDGKYINETRTLVHDGYRPATENDLFWSVGEMIEESHWETTYTIADNYRPTVIVK